MPDWINGGSYIGVDLNPGGLSVILKNYTDAINERFDLLVSGETKPQYHTVNGNKESPALVDFAGTGNDDGMDFDEIPQTLDDIEAGIDSLLGFVDFMDPDAIDTQYTTFAQVALDATRRLTRPLVNMTDKALWNFYKDTIAKLIVVHISTLGESLDSAIRYSGDPDASNETAWDLFLTAGGVGSTGGRVQIINDKHRFQDKFSWGGRDEGEVSYDLAAPLGGSILKDKITINKLVLTGMSVPAPSFQFTITFDGGAGPTETPTVTGTGTIVYGGEAPTLYGLLRDDGVVKFEINHGTLPDNALWIIESDFFQFVAVVLGNQIGGSSLLAEMWIDYTSELEFV